MGRIELGRIEALLSHTLVSPLIGLGGFGTVTVVSGLGGVTTRAASVVLVGALVCTVITGGEFWSLLD